MDKEEMREFLRKNICEFIQDYRVKNSIETEWKKPLLGFADASGEYVRSLKQQVSPTHYMPQEFLADCTIVIVYALPFVESIGQSNVGGEAPSAAWMKGYNETNTMFPCINDHLIRVIRELGYEAVNPRNIGRVDKTHIYSNWSQRHLAVAAGLGTLGLNNMLITDEGTCVRLFSLVTDLPVTPDVPLAEERCLYKRDGSCGLCAKRCPVEALHGDAPFERVKCSDRLAVQKAAFGTGACGKCVVGMPCTFRNPAAR